MSKHLRPHQKAILKKIDSPSLVVEATPGSGKSKMAVAYAHELRRAGIINRVCWIVPRLSLKEQAVDDFADRQFLEVIGVRVAQEGRHPYELNAPPGNKQTRPWDGAFGYVTTYDSVDENPMLHEAAMTADGGRTLLIVDECHHVVHDTPRARHVRLLADKCVRVLRMSGALVRNDARERIADIPYEPVLDAHGRETSMSRPRVDVPYKRVEAIHDGVIRPLDFVHYDAEVEFRRRNGDVVQLSSLKKATDRDEGAAIWSAIQTEFAKKMTADAVKSWVEYRDRGTYDTKGAWFPPNRHAKMIVVCANIEQAKDVLVWLRTDHGLWSASIATSDETEEARDAIKSFRHNDSSSALVTVAMAYEGLDVQDITHVLCLTHIRAYSWHNQMLSRATRVSRRVPDKYCVAFVMDDESMCDVVEQFEQDQGDALNLLEMLDAEGRDGGRERTGLDGEVTPIASDVSGVRGHFAPDGCVAHPNVREREVVEASLRSGGVSEQKIAEVLRVLYGATEARAESSSAAPYMGPERRKADRRKEYERLCNQIVKVNDWRTVDGKYDWARPRKDIKGRMCRRHGDRFDTRNATEAQLDEMLEMAREHLRSRTAE